MSCPVQKVIPDEDAQGKKVGEEEIVARPDGLGIMQDRKIKREIDREAAKNPWISKKDKFAVKSFVILAILVLGEMSLEVSLAQDGAVRDGRLVRVLLWNLAKLHHDHDLIMSSCSHDPTVNTTQLILKDKLHDFKKTYKHAKRNIIGIRDTADKYRAFAKAFTTVKNESSVVPICDRSNTLIEGTFEATNNYYVYTLSEYRKSIQDAVQHHLHYVSKFDVITRVFVWFVVAFYCYAWRMMNSLDPENQAKLKWIKPKRSFIHDIAVPIVVADKFMIIKDVNDAVAAVFGWTKQEMIGQNVTMLMPQTLREEHYSFVERYLTTKKAGIIGNTGGRPVSGVHKDGSELHLIINISQSGEDQVNNPTFTAVLQDITQQHKAQEAEKIKQEEMLLMMDNQQKLLDHLHAPVCIATYDMIILKANFALQKIFEYTEDELVGQNVKKLMFKEDADQHDTRVGRYKTTGEKRVIGKSRNIFGKTKSGSRLDLILNMAESKDATGTKYIAIFHDMTEKKGHDG